jgi:hypothetical protein
MNNFLPFIIAASVVAGIVALRAGYVAHSNLNDPEELYQTGTPYMDNSIFTGFFGRSGGGKKTRHRKHKNGKNTRRK